jgi:hypothetical protein
MLMSNPTRTVSQSAGRDFLRWEIGAALLVKVLLLTGLWSPFFRGGGESAKPDVGALFVAGAAAGSHSSTSQSEDAHGR